MNRREYFLGKFPNLRGTNWEITSRKTKRYNCLAWAACETHRPWDCRKGAYWPEGVKKLDGIAYLVHAFLVSGFVVCRREECMAYDPEYDTVVLYELDACGSHAARLLENGMWSSKMGNLEDIQHPTPESVAGIEYGQPLVYMKRKRTPKKTKRARRKR